MTLKVSVMHNKSKTRVPLGIVLIGRNEGARLLRCLASVRPDIHTVVYVDSGSTDGSQQAAHDNGAHVVELEKSTPFTAARARNIGFTQLLSLEPDLEYIQFIDGDCELQPDWISMAVNFLDAHPEVAVTCGRRRERFPEVSVYNRLIDREWDTPVGEARACGGDALMRVVALQQVEGFNPNLIAGEEPELCVRLRAKDWKIWRLDTEMTLHDAALMRLSQWWNRNRRAGHAYAEGSALHGAPPECHGVQQTRSALFWGAILPALALLGACFFPWALMLLAAWPLQIMRLVLRGENWTRAFFLVLGKLPEAQGVLGFWWRARLGVRSTLIEYK